MTATATARDPAEVRSRSRLRLALRILAALILLFGALVAGDALLLAHRLHHVRVAFPSGGTGQTWVIVGDDSRTSVPDGRDVYGSVTVAPGHHADVVLLVHKDAGRTSVLSIPRDLLVSPARGQIARLALTLDPGPQALVDSLCTTLGIAANHLVMIDMRTFAGVVDALGGIRVNLEYPIRDAYSGLDIPDAGRVRLDGTQLLALVRSRSAEQLIDGRWVGETEAQGATARAHWAGVVFAALSAAARSSNPVTLQRLAWALTGGTTTDTHTGLTDLLGLRGLGASAATLPVTTEPGSLAVVANAATAATAATIERIMGTGHCRPSLDRGVGSG